MIKLRINNIQTEVKPGTTVLEAARNLKIEIPTMCYLAGLTNNPSCMVCLVEDCRSGKLQPSCALPCEEDMEITTDNERIHNARKEALELMLSDHVGDCEAPCQPSCPASMDIPMMNRYLEQGDNANAIRTIKKDIAIPITLGYICPAPCEKACRRTQIDSVVSICDLKKFSAIKDLESSKPYFPEIPNKSNKKVAIVGTGPAGLSCAYYLLTMGHECTLFDRNEHAGGALYYDIPEEKLPKDHLKLEIDHILSFGAKTITNTNVDINFINERLNNEFDAIVLATGDFERSGLDNSEFQSTKFGIEIDKETFMVNNVGLFACGNIVRSRRMAVSSAAQGKLTAESVNSYLKGRQHVKQPRMFNSKFGKLIEPEFKEYLKEANTIDSLTLQIGEPYNFNAEQSSTEASRCMHCDCRKPETCKLRIYSDQYNADKNRFAFTERKLVRKFTENATLIYEPEKCIKCNVCVEICAREKNTIGFTNIGRGMEMEINVPMGHSISEIIEKTAILCAEHCPTAAISLK
jgi:NADPH-dependent glutamate synthase beta subunit-like oxidoreductase